MSDSALSKAWKWSVEASPLLNTWRWLRHMGYPNRKAFAMLEAAGLPKPVDALIRKTVRKSKLWATERAEIARELIAHAHDAIEAGRTGEEIAQTFGDPKRIAKLMRRSMKRKRPLYWRAYRNMKRATVMMILVLIVGYGSLAARFYMGTPSVKRNYIAELNARNDGYAEDEKAWGVYRDVEAQWQRLAADTALLRLGSDLKPVRIQYNNLGFESDNEHYDEMVMMVKSFGPEMNLIREAAARPVMGMVYSYDLETVEVDGAYVSDSISPAADPNDQGPMVSVLLPDLGIGRGLVNLLLLDAELAVQERDSGRAIQDIEASLRIGNQINDTGFLISSMVAASIVQKAGSVLEQLLKENSGLFTLAELKDLAGLFEEASGAGTVRYDMEIWMFEDFLQRAYTDDGHGNGRITPRGVKMLSNWNYSWMYEEVEDSKQFEDYLEAAKHPATLFAMEDRKSQSKRFAEHIKQTQQVLVDGPDSIGWLDFYGDLQGDASNDWLIDSPMNSLAASMARSVSTVFLSQMESGAIQTMIALEVYRSKEGQYPESIGALVPGFIDQLPEDLFRLGNPIQYLLSDDGYLLYSAGADGDLDGGVEVEGFGGGRANSFTDRYRFLTTEEFDSDKFDEVEVLLDQSGKPRFSKREVLDSDWILIDMRRMPETVPEPINGE